MSKQKLDIDLSVLILNENWHFQGQVSYTNLRSDTLGIFHSGDIIDAPKGASEFIDINIKKTLKNKGRYIIIVLYSFSSQPFCDLDVCFSGWMKRNNSNSGEIYEPKTVQNKIDLASNSIISIPLVIDIVDKWIYWADLSLKEHPNHSINNENNHSQLELMGRAITEIHKPNLFDLFMLHILARNGKIVTKKRNADIIFSIDEGITPFNQEKIIAEYLS